jgi:hypothetical protein
MAGFWENFSRLEVKLIKAPLQSLILSNAILSEGRGVAKVEFDTIKCQQIKYQLD